MARVVLFNGVEVYAPWCPTCRSDAHTKWDRLPVVGDADGWKDRGVGLCRGCGGESNADRLETWKAREPERLAARLAELKAGAEVKAKAAGIRDVELTREEVAAQAAEFARRLNFASFDEALAALDAGSINGSANELHARSLRHLLGK